jgi:WD40 repeat protein
VPEKLLTQIAFDPTGRQLALAVEGGQIRRWDIAEGDELTPFRSPAKSSLGVAFSPDGRLVASGGEGRAVTFWDTDTGQIRHVLHGHGATVTGVAFSPDSRLLAASSVDNTLRVWDVREGQLLLTLPVNLRSVRAPGFSPDGRTLAAASWDDGRALISLWDAGPSRPEPILRGHRGPVRTVVYSPDGRVLASSGTDNSIRIWDAASGLFLRQIETDTSESVLFFSRDGKHLTPDSGGKSVWEVETGRRIGDVLKDFRVAASGPLSPDGRSIAVIEGDLIRLVRLNGDECEQGRRRLLLEEDVFWHSDTAAHMEAMKRQDFAAAFHLERLARLSPWNAELWLRHGRACARAGQKDRAAISFLQAVFLNPRLAP